MRGSLPETRPSWNAWRGKPVTRVPFHVAILFTLRGRQPCRHGVVTWHDKALAISSTARVGLIVRHGGGGKIFKMAP